MRKPLPQPLRDPQIVQTRLREIKQNQREIEAEDDFIVANPSYLYLAGYESALRWILDTWFGIKLEEDE